MRTVFFILAALNLSMAALLWPSPAKEPAAAEASRGAQIGDLRLVGEGAAAPDLKSLSQSKPSVASQAPADPREDASAQSSQAPAPIACLQWAGLTGADKALIEPALTKVEPMRLASEPEPARARFWVTLRQGSVAQAQQRLERLEKLGEAPGWRLWGASVRGGPYESETLARAEAQRVESKGGGAATVEKDAQPLWVARFGPWPDALKGKLKDLEADIPGSKITVCSEQGMASWERALAARRPVKKETGARG